MDYGGATGGGEIFEFVLNHSRTHVPRYRPVEGKRVCVLIVSQSLTITCWRTFCVLVAIKELGYYIYSTPPGRRPQNKGGWVLGRGGPNKLFPQKNVLPEMAQEEEKKVKQNIFFGPHTKPQSNVLTVFHYTPRT